MRTFVLLCCAAATMCANVKCIEDVAKTVEDVAQAGTLVKVVVEACQNSTRAECMKGVREIAASLDAAADEAAAVSETCAGVSVMCGKDVDGTAAALKGSVASITKAITDCGNSTRKPECVVDVLDTAANLGTAAFDIYKATFDCKKNSTKPVDNCATEVVATLEDARKSATAIKAAVEACTHKQHCLAALEAATTSAEATSAEVAKASEKCGSKTAAGKCIADVSESLKSLLEATRKGEAAKSVCSKGSFHFIKCIEDIVAIAADLAHSSGDMIAATAKCKEIK